MKKTMTWAGATLAALAPACVAGQQAMERAAGTITERDMAERIGVIAHDSM